MGLFKKKKKNKEQKVNETAPVTEENTGGTAAQSAEENAEPKETEDNPAPEEEAPAEEVVKEEPEEEVMSVEYVTREDPALKLLQIERETPEHPLHETDKGKFLDTMWFTQESMVYSNRKDRLDFEVTVYPLADGPDGYPVPVIAAIRRSNVFKVMISNGDNLSVGLVYEGLLVNCTGFFKDGEFDSRISVTTTNGDKVEIKTLKKKQYAGSILPANFGKKIYVGGDSVEIFPMATENDKATGCVHFLWVQLKANGEVFYGSSDQQQKANLDFTGEGVKTIISYWKKTDEHDGARPFISAEIS